MEKLPPGTRLQVGSHDVEIVKYLAEGGFAHIYTVKPKPIEDGLEIACLKRVIVKTKPELNLLRKEVDTMKKLANNEYVVKYYDSNAQKLEDGTYEVLLLMEYCPNKSLLDLMNQHLKTKLSTAQILKIMFEISVAVSSMHYMNLIHRDLKVENVLINANNDFKLADFGSTSGFIAPPTNQEEFQAIAHDILYQTTPQYRAPEMIDLYKNVPIDYKSDIWALGVFLYKLMYYTTPFEAQGELAILHGYFQFPHGGPKYPSRLKNLVIIMLQVDATLRPNIYQVVYELCDILEKKVPIEDYYGLGPYNFEEYAKYQQQLQYQQQQLQQQQIQQQQLQQQKLMEQEMLRQRAEATRVDDLKANTNQKQYVGGEPQEANQQLPKEPSKQDFNAPPQMLTRSTNPSSGDLQNLADEAERQGVSEKTPDPIPKQPTGGYNEDDSERRFKEDEENEAEDDLENVEERYPSLEELDEAAAEKRFPDVDKFDPFKGRKSSDEKRSDSNITRSSSKKSQPLSDAPNEDEQDIAKPGLKLSHTEAWTAPASEPDKSIDLDGVFHKQEESIDSQSHNKIDSTPRKSFEIGDRKSFESGQSRKSLEQRIISPQASAASPHFSPPQAQQPNPVYNQQIGYDIPPQPSSQAHYYSPLNQQQQQQPHLPYVTTQPQETQYFQYPTQPQQQQQNQYQPSTIPIPQNPQPQAPPQQQQQQPYQPQSFNQYENSNSIPGIRGSRNPFPHPDSKNPFPTSRSSLEVNTQPVKAEKSGGNPWAEYTQSPQVGPISQHQILVQGQLQQSKQPYSTNSVPKVSQSSNFSDSPKIKITPSEKLIDLDDSPKKESKQPKLNLDLLELDISEPNSSTDDLKFEELKVKPSRKPSYASQKKTSPKENPPALPIRKSSELSRINLDLEELDLEDEKNENVLVDEEEIKIEPKSSRRSLSLNRTSSSKTARAKPSKGSRPEAEHRKSSFLGFRSKE